MSKFQQWLSLRPPRSYIADQAILAGPRDSVYFEWIKVVKNGVLTPVLQATYDLEHPFNKEGNAKPPLHIHLYQDEYFEVLHGALGFVINGQQGLLTSLTQPGLIRAGARHTFWLDLEKSGVDCKYIQFHCWVSSPASPPSSPAKDNDKGWDEVFFRNIQAYLADCARYGLKPSKYQTTLFRYEADTVLTPPFWMPKRLLKGWRFVQGHVIGGKLLGYKSQYPEYAPLRPRGRKSSIRLYSEKV